MVTETVGRYEILETLGRGAMGVVYRARDPIIDREVALKTLRVDLDAELAVEFRERFMREARAAGRLNHANIVTIHDVGEDPGSGLVFIAMEHIRGSNLKQVLSSGRRFEHAEAARIAAELAMALDYAHSMGVVHRDIKPANIILTDDGTPKITDFGVARLESSNLTVEGQFIGTPNYMSPEQVTGGLVDGRSDLFSLGVVLFEMLTEQRPFPGNTMHEVTHRIVGEAAPIPSVLNAELPPAFNPILLRCLEKDPERRYQTGGELATVLAALARSVVPRQTEGTPARDRAASASAEVEPTLLSRPAALDRRLLQRLPIPAFLRSEVNPAWVAGIIAGWFLLWLGVGGVLLLQLDSGPFVAPSGASIRNLNQTVSTLMEAESLLAAGDAAVARSRCQHALDQAPWSPAARGIMASARAVLIEESAASGSQDRILDLVGEGRRLYGQGRYLEASDRFNEALELEPDSELALSYLELSQERLRSARAVPRQTRDTRPRAGPAVSLPTVQARPTPSAARVTVFFDSPINAGSVVVTVDGQRVGDIPFDFTEKGLLGIRRKGAGKVKRVLMVAAGRRSIGIELVDTERGSLGAASFTEVLPGGSDWALRVNLPSKKTPEADFFLVRSAG
jgi:tRNA A-37 threonylcarbamoyl transferase component Bud32